MARSAKPPRSKHLLAADRAARAWLEEEIPDLLTLIEERELSLADLLQAVFLAGEVEGRTNVAEVVRRTFRGKGHGPADLMTISETANWLRIAPQGLREALKAKGLVRKIHGRDRVLVRDVLDAFPPTRKGRTRLVKPVVRLPLADL